MLTACQTTPPQETFSASDFRVSQVNVTVPSSAEVTGEFKSRLENALNNNVKVYNKTRSGELKSYTLNVNVTRVNFLNPLKDLLSGDGNYTNATTTLINAGDQRHITSFQNRYFDSENYDHDGLNKDPKRSVEAQRKTEDILAKGLAANIMKSVYPGTQLTPEDSAYVRSDLVLFQPKDS